MNIAAVEKTVKALTIGDRVRGLSLEQEPLEGIVTSIGLKYATLDDNRKTSVWVDSIEIIESAFPWTFIPDWLNQFKADHWLELSQSLVEWQHNDIRMFGKTIALPRLEAIIGDGDYSYNGLILKAQPWNKSFLDLKEEIEDASGYGFAIAIGNQYRDGNDHIGWHSDDSPEMGKCPAIASLSLGATRKFQLRHKVTKEIHGFELTHGSLLIMHPGCQEEYQHRLCKNSKQTGLRINWTFRPLTSTAAQRDAIDNSHSTIIENHAESITTLPDSTLKVGDRVSYKGQDWEVKAFGGEAVITLNRDAGKTITSSRVCRQDLLKEAIAIQAPQPKRPASPFHDAYLEEAIALEAESLKPSWKIGDRITPAHRPGSRIGSITGINLKNKRTPLLVRFDGEETEGKWGNEAVVAADSSEIIEVEIIENRTEVEIIEDRIALAQLESQIQSGLDLCKKGEQQIWIAAHQIRSQVLWGDEFANFEDYCKQRWGWEKSNAHEVASAGEIITQLQESGVSDLPTSVAALRPLRKLEPAQRLQVLEIAKTDTGKITADSVKQAVTQLLTPPPPIDEHEPTSKYEYVPIEPRQCWFVDGKEVMEAEAIARNGNGMIRLLWGDGQDSAVPEKRVQWEVPKAELPDPGKAGNEAGELTKDQKTLLYNLKAIAQQKADEIYNALCTLNTDADSSDIAEISDELNTAIIKILEFHFL